MKQREIIESLRGIIGYLNFSDGAFSAAFFRAIDTYYRACQLSGEKAFQSLLGSLRSQIQDWKVGNSPFGDLSRAEQSLELAEQSLSAFRQFHSDILHHASPDDLLLPFFVGRLFEHTLRVLSTQVDERSLKSIDESLAPNTLAVVLSMSDFIGYRPVAVLENNRLCEPYLHERIAVIPLYFKSVGISSGPHAEVLGYALELLRHADPDLLSDVWLDLDTIEEIALDPRAYDHHHPVNMRPGYQFGEFDPYRINTKGRYTRLVIRQVITDTLHRWRQEEALGDENELLKEAGAVLAGTFLLACGACGGGPDDLRSDQHVAQLVARIARVRDQFYTDLVAQWPGKHGDRLRREAERDRQPFGRLRQHLNLQLGVLRALQLQHDLMAQYYARMGFAEAASAEAAAVAAPYARMRCLIETAFTDCRRALSSEELDEAINHLIQIAQILRRAIECGAMVDPWNILAFNGHFPWFSHLAESTQDGRVQDLLMIVERLFDHWARVWAAAAAAGREDLSERCRDHTAGLAEWWDRFATFEVKDLPRVCGTELRNSAEFVARILAEWRRSGSASGDISFWSRHSEHFKEAQTYGLVLESLMQKNDLVATQSLLVHWLGCSDAAANESTAEVFFDFAQQWLLAALAVEEPRRQQLIVRFFELLEANADVYWHAPKAESLGLAKQPRRKKKGRQAGHAENEESDDPFSAAYEGMIYRDTTDDGNEGPTMEAGSSHHPLEAIEEGLNRRLHFLILVFRLLQKAAAANWNPADEKLQETFLGWANWARANRESLMGVMQAVQDQPIADPIGVLEANHEIDRQHSVREHLLEGIVSCVVEAAQAQHSLMAWSQPHSTTHDWESLLIKVRSAVHRMNRRSARVHLRRLLKALKPLEVLYVPIRLGGDPLHFCQTRLVRESIRRLAEDLPWLGLFRETADLIRVARMMERNGRRDSRQVTEFESIFTAGYRSVLEVLIRLLNEWKDTRDSDELAAIHVNEVVSRFSHIWREHVSSVRISEIEVRSNPAAWTATKRFIEKYGRELFTPRFMQYGNLRGILAQGIDRFLDSLAHADGDIPEQMMADLESGRLRRDEASGHLSFILTVVVNHYDVFRDYTATTTQSDYGENLFSLFELLRVSVDYDNHWWLVRPALFAHRALTALGRQQAADYLQLAMAEELERWAQEHVRALKAVENKYGVRLASINDKIQERFTRGFRLDRVLALVEPAIENNASTDVFDDFKSRLAEFVNKPTGSGFEPPDWANKLRDEIQRVMEKDDGEFCHRSRKLPKMRRAEWEAQLKDWDDPGRA